jgi:hypothetical protein
LNSKDSWTMMAIGWLPDLALSWAYMKLYGNEWPTFWWCLLVLAVIQLFFVVKQIISGSLIFRLYGKNKVADAIAHELREKKYPWPQTHEDFHSYMIRLADDEDASTDLRLNAQSMLTGLVTLEQQGLFQSLRMNSAYDLALKRFSGEVK